MHSRLCYYLLILYTHFHSYDYNHVMRVHMCAYLCARVNTRVLISVCSRPCVHMLVFKYICLRRARTYAG